MRAGRIGGAEGADDVSIDGCMVSLIATGGDVCAAKARSINPLAASVPSAPQTGQATGLGMRPFIGATSKE